MKKMSKIFLMFLALTLVASVSFAAGDAAKGKTYFNDPKFAGGTSGSSCNTCHPDGKGLEKVFQKGRTAWQNPGGTWLNIEDTNNVCIMMAMKGKTIDPKGQEMKDLNAYIKSLVKK